MKILVTGVKGQLGYDVVQMLKKNNIDHLGIDKDELDITIESDVATFIYGFKPTVIIHCAAYTAVDKAEEDQKNCYNINVLGTEYLAKAAKGVNAKFLYISTDYVFDGQGTLPFTVVDNPKPINYYGLTKYHGEIAVQKFLSDYYIVRVSWVFGINGNNFIKTMLRLAETKKEINVVADQIGSPTYTVDLAIYIIELMQTNNFGIYHATNEGFCSWHEFAIEIFKTAKMEMKVNPITSDQYPTIAKRPLNSRMKKNGVPMNHWKTALALFFEELHHND